ncbi:hypothetical protein K432DRAFT_218318 [Lepidopterella palustris CBS 459.81]|uniref:CCR4-NOT transcription complex subunit 11 n=1 Tax=Lepidopterella palustris CBS 459.81 TaxID=1314670 RepID=A0A8E2EF03_9PEZI|nr:hypothetical protein K432DRAFT_218318 [Lepidopterella palustris CBS 459.81]
MDVSATLTDELVAAFSDDNRTLQETGTVFEDARETQARHHPDQATFEALFQDSLRLKNKLDELEQQVDTNSSFPHLAVILNCEYQLYKLNEATPLRYNPFLSHWVEVVQVWEKKLGKSDRQNEIHPATSGIGWFQIHRTRIEFVKAILTSQNILELSTKSPNSIYEYFQQKTTPVFNISPYITILEDEGIYEKSPVPKVDPSESASNNRPNRTQALLSHLEASPSTSVPILTHLPLDLSSLDLLTTLLQNRTLEGLSIDPNPVIRDYVQHSLRLIERMGPPPSNPTPSFSSAVDDGEPYEMAEDREQNETLPNCDREAQIRAVKLLLLFIRNLVRKALLPPEDIYFEIQEICVRYVWIKEVREFRAFIEEGADAGEG